MIDAILFSIKVLESRKAPKYLRVTEGVSPFVAKILTELGYTVAGGVVRW